MLKKIIIFFLVLLSFMMTSYSYTNISSCTDDPNTAGEWRLNQSISFMGGNCLSITGSDNILLDCQGYSISGNQSNGISADLVFKNITVQNCNINGFASNLHIRWLDNSVFKNLNSTNSTLEGIKIYGGASNNSFSNININDVTGVGIAISDSTTINNSFSNININNVSARAINVFTYAKNNTFNDIIITNADYGMYFTNSDNNIFSNIKISNSLTEAFVLRGSNNNIIRDNDFRNNVGDTIFFRDAGSGIPTGNIFYRNYLKSNTSMGRSTGIDLSGNSFNSSSEGNYWDDFNSSIHPPYCFKNLCDNLASSSNPILISSSKSNFPFLNIISLFIMNIALLFYFIFGV